MDIARKNLENIEVNFENVRPSRNRFDGESGLSEWLVQELKSVYYTEKIMLKSFAKIIKNSCSVELIEALAIHHDESKQHVIRIEDVFSLLNEPPTLERCKTIETLLENIDSVIEDTKFGLVRDAGIVFGMHRIEQHEISTYSMLATFAENLGQNGVVLLLSETINEEKVAALRLEKIAQTIRFYSSGTI